MDCWSIYLKLIQFPFENVKCYQVPGIGIETVKALKKAGIFTTHQLLGESCRTSDHPAFV